MALRGEKTPLHVQVAKANEWALECIATNDLIFRFRDQSHLSMIKEMTGADLTEMNKTQKDVVFTQIHS
jgi:hypothetical protein